jgi:predicted transcriptional regulator
MGGRRSLRVPELGELERAVLDHLWTKGEADVLEVYRAVGVKRGISANTVGSALERLYRKDLAVRTKVSHAYRYAAACKREEFLGRQIAATLGDMRRLAGSGVLASFLDVVTATDRKALEELEALVAKKRKSMQ